MLMKTSRKARRLVYAMFAVLPILLLLALTLAVWAFSLRDSRLASAVYWGRTQTAIRLLNHGADARYRYYNIQHEPVWRQWVHLLPGMQNKMSLSLPVLMLVEHERHNSKPWTLPDNPEMMRALLEAGADPNAPDLIERTPLMLAARNNKKETLELLRHGADVNRAGIDGVTALMYAANYADPEVVQQLIAAHPDVNAQMKQAQWTALMSAVYVGSQEKVQLLLKAHADPNVRNRRGDTALSIALRRRFPKVAALLKQVGAR